MSNFVMIHVNLTKQFHKELHDLMDSVIKDNENRIRYQLHKGSKQQFYRELLEIGLNEMYKRISDKKKELELQ